MEIGVELASQDPSYEDLAIRMINQFILIAHTVNRMGAEGMWDEEDGFYYDMLRLPDGRSTRLKVRSVVGLLPFCAATVVESWQRKRVPRVLAYFQSELRRHPELLAVMHETGPGISASPSGVL